MFRVGSQTLKSLIHINIHFYFNLQFTASLLILVLSTTNGSYHIKSLQSCSTWTHLLKNNADSGSRPVDCTSAFKKCPKIVNLRQKQNIVASNPLIVSGTEDRSNYQPLFSDIKSFQNKLLRKIVLNSARLTISNISRPNSEEEQ